jgi:type IV pilus modification protein PilV
MRSQQKFRRHTWKSSQAGVTLIEVMISVVVLTAGLVGMLAVVGFAVSVTNSAQQDMVAKQLASETMESIFTARETADLSWAEIQNAGTGNTPDGVFVTGFKAIHNAGTDGIYGTADDDDAPERTLTQVGRDGILGTTDDREQPLTSFRRKVEFTAITGTTALRLVTITIQYNVAPLAVPKSYVVTAYISQFR